MGWFTQEAKKEVKACGNEILSQLFGNRKKNTNQKISGSDKELKELRKRTKRQFEELSELQVLLRSTVD